MPLFKALKTGLQAILKPFDLGKRQTTRKQRKKGLNLVKTKEKELAVGKTIKEIQDEIKRKKNKKAKGQVHRKKEADEEFDEFDEEEGEGDEEDEGSEEEIEEDGLDLGEDLTGDESEASAMAADEVKKRRSKRKDPNKAAVDPNDLSEGQPTVQAEPLDAAEMKKIEAEAAKKAKSIKVVGEKDMSSSAYSRDGFVEKGSSGVQDLAEMDAAYGKKQDKKIIMAKKVLTGAVIKGIKFDSEFGLIESILVSKGGMSFILSGDQITVKRVKK